MGYTALKKMGEKNKVQYDINFPREPRDYRDYKDCRNLERACLDFIRETCQELRFDKDDPKKINLDDCEGRSLESGQIPYNMEMDIDRLCFENAIHRFLKSGIAEDAFDVYFCFIEMFLDGYEKTKRLNEMLAEYEKNGSSLLAKHRDHYVHSVYVFVLGIALYEKNSFISKGYNEKYNFKDNRDGAEHFLKYWGMTALFHDIGYPFELPFEQAKSYFGKKNKEEMKLVPYLAYRNLDGFIVLSEKQKEKLQKILGKNLEKSNMLEVIAVHLEKSGSTDGKNSEEIYDILKDKPGNPQNFDYYMDHAYFSAVLLFRYLLESDEEAKEFKEEFLDVIDAIVLHNSLYKFKIKETDKKFKIEWNPLAYLLMLCDELQCWDRNSYGKDSRKELHPMWCEFEFKDNTVNVVYIYDKRLEKRFTEEGLKNKVSKYKGKKGILGDILDILCMKSEDGSSKIKLEMKAELRKSDRKRKLNASSSSYWNLYRFAVALNYRYVKKQIDNFDDVSFEEMKEEFAKRSLEYKLSNILQAKEFAHHLDEIGCFYTDRAVDYESVESFGKKQLDIVAELEHMRWFREKESMGWRYDDVYWDKQKVKEVLEKNATSKEVSEEAVELECNRLRELSRTHRMMILDYDALSEEEYKKDTEPWNIMLKLTELEDGVRVYRKN